MGTSTVNVFACLVHESPECVHDLLDNLAYLDGESMVLLYDGSGGSLIARLDLRSRPEVIAVPWPKPMAWGKLHDFAIDSMRFAVDKLEFDTLTIVDSDQLLLRRGYTRHIERFLSQHSGVGCLVSKPGPQPPTTRIEPAQAAWQEIGLWRPFLRRFPTGESTFPQWTFWPSTVFTEHAVRDLLALWKDDSLQQILGHTRILASEEVILPSLVALSGHEIVSNPCAYDLVQYRKRFSPDQLEAAMGRDDVFWVHPIPRKLDDPLRTLVRDRYRDYGAAISPDKPRRFPRTLDLINRMQSVEGWLSGPEADLLAAAAVRALSELPAPHAVVEVGSYCGRATVVLGSVVQNVRPGSKVHTFDPHDGTQGERDRLVRGQPASHRRLLSNIDRLGLTDVVRPVVARSADVEWSDPISLLVIDRLHDYASVATDFAQFQAHLVIGGLVAFHDYADYFPGVRAWVNQLKTSGTYAPVDQVDSMMIMEKTRSLPLPPIGEIVEKAGSMHGPLGADEAALLFLAAARALTECDHGKVVSTGDPNDLSASVLAIAASAAGRNGASNDPNDLICLLTVGTGQNRPEPAEVVDLLDQVAIGGFTVFLDSSVQAGSNIVGHAVHSRLFERALSYGCAVAIRRVRPGRLRLQYHPASRPPP